MLWLMPVMRQYHVIWAAPAMTMISAVIHYKGNRHRWSIFAFACAAGVVLGEFALWSDLLKAADEALYRAKHEGRSRLVIGPGR